jgi:hypothetical protein
MSAPHRFPPTTAPMLVGEARAAYNPFLVAALAEHPRIFLTGMTGAGKTALLTTITGNRVDVYVDHVTRDVIIQSQGDNRKYILVPWNNSGSMQFALANTAIQLLLSADVIVFDHIECMTALELELVNCMFAIERVAAPFGGRRIIVSGDFALRTPINLGAYAFEADIWARSCFHVFHMPEPPLGDIIKNIRVGSCDFDAIDELCERSSTHQFPYHINPTLLCSHSHTATAINNGHLAALLTAGKHYIYVDGRLLCDHTQVVFTHGCIVPLARDISCQSPAESESRFVPAGSRAIIIRLPRESQSAAQPHPIVRLADGQCVYAMVSTLRPAWALSISKTAGMKLDCVELDMDSGLTSAHDVYTALTRLKDIESMRVKVVHRGGFILPPKIVAFYKEHARRSTQTCSQVNQDLKNIAESVARFVI